MTVNDLSHMLYGKKAYLIIIRNRRSTWMFEGYAREISERDSKNDMFNKEILRIGVADRTNHSVTTINCIINIY